MSDLTLIDIGRKTLYLVMLLSGPMLLVALVVGLVVSVVQAATQISEMTLTFIPKLVSIGLVLLVLMPWMLREYRDFFNQLLGMIPALLR